MFRSSNEKALFRIMYFIFDCIDPEETAKVRRKKKRKRKEREKKRERTCVLKE